MSTCPNSDLYSAYVDGEVPSPWKEKLEAHISHCKNCRERVFRYEALSKILKIDTSIPTQEFLSESLAKLESKIAVRKQQRLLSNQHKESVIFWKNSSIRMPIPLFAALFLAAIFIPTFFTRKAAEELYNMKEVASATHPLINTVGFGTNSHEIINTSSSVYSTDLPEKTIASYLTSSSGQQIFTMINYARKFATNKDLFSEAEIIIIKLPNITQFSNTGENSFFLTEPLQQAAGYYK